MMTRQTNKPSLLLLLITAVLLLGQTTTTAQPNTWIDPRHPSVAWLQEWGYMTGTGLPCKPNWGEEFGRGIIPVGDVNGDAIADFILERSRCDTGFGGVRPNELLLYYGVKGRLPASASGLRIGPSEIGSKSRLLTIGDFDGDRHPDLVCRINIIGDTTGQADGRDVGYPTIFWGNQQGTYSLQDTTRLPCNADIWLGPHGALAWDQHGDGITILLLFSSLVGYTNATAIPLPELLVYQCQKGERWGRNGKSYEPLQTWWRLPIEFTRYRLLDADCDGNRDLIFQDNSFGPEKITVAYQRNDDTVIDTNDLESIELTAFNGRFGLFQDVTGDKIPDLITRNGDFEGSRIRIFAGAPGQRLKEQYGNGYDSADRANNRYPLRPWAQIMSPNALHEGWFDWDYSLFDLGDINEDGTSEIVAFSKPFILFYTTGNTLDSLIDIMFQVPGDSWATIRHIGDVDGSGKVSYAVNFDEKIHFLKAPPKDEIPTYGGRIRSLPHPRDFQCNKASSVEEQAPLPDKLDLSKQGGVLPDLHFYHR